MRRSFSKVLVPALACLLVPALATAQEQWEPYPDPAPGGGSIAEATVVDPMGDTHGTGTPQHDITELTVNHDGANLFMDLTFAGTISPPGSGNADELIGLFEMDTDQNAGTGIPGGNVSVFCPQAVTFGVDFLVNCDPSGTCAILDSASSQVGTASFTSTSNTFGLTIPLSDISDDGVADISVVVGTVPEPTDCAPNGGTVTSDLVPVELMSFDVQ